MNDKWTREDTKLMLWYVVFILVFLLLIIGPSPYWLDSGGVILK